jgi:ABC-type ATPase involved in cell division
MGRLLITNTAGDLFCQFEWGDNDGFHTKRVTEDMPADIRRKALEVIDWADVAEKTDYAPKQEVYAEKQRIQQEMGRLQKRLKQL